jgi:glutamate carboxypeptidase
MTDSKQKQVQIVAELKDFVSINSYTYNLKGVKQAAEYVVERLKPLGFSVATYKSSEAGYGELTVLTSDSQDSNKPQIVLSGHVDTVFENHEGFDIRFDDGKLHGPGTVDMKGGVQVLIEALRALSEENELKNITVLLFPEEEQIGMDRFPQLAEILDGKDFALIFEGDGVTGNFDPKNQSLVVQRKGNFWFNLIANASGGHAGAITELTDRHSAVHELIYQAQKVLGWADYKEGTTVSVSKFNGGSVINALAENANILVDIRMSAGDEYERIKNELAVLTSDKQDSKVDLELVRMHYSYPAEYKQSTKKFFARAQIVAEKMGIKLSEEYRGSGSDAVRIALYNKEIAILDNLGPVGANEHTVNEYVIIDSLLQKIEFSKALIRDILQN